MISLPSQAIAILSDATKLAQVDFHPRPITLMAAEDNKLHAIYRGAYIAGEVSVPLKEGEDFPVTVVGAVELFELLKLFSGVEEVSFAQSGNALTLAGGGRKAHLQILPDEAAETMILRNTSLIIANYDNLCTELSVAASFINEANHMPILGGVRILKRSAGSFILMAHDGRAGLYAGSVACEKSDLIVDATIQPKDLLAALSVIGRGDGSVNLALERNEAGVVTRAGVNNARGSVIVGVLSGTWPSTDSLTNPIPRETVVLPSDALDFVVSGIKALDAEQVVILARSESGIRICTGESEKGSFEVAITSEVTFDRVVFGALEIGLATLLGKNITIDVCLDKGASLVRAENRRYWITRKLEKA